MKNKKPYFIVLPVIILIIGTVFYLVTQKNNPDTTNKQRANDVKSSQPIKVPSDSSKNLPTNPGETKTEDVPSSQDLNVFITEFNQKDRTVFVRASTTGSGTCVFQFTTDGDKPVTIETQASDKTCAVSVPEVQFSKIGTWKLNVVYYYKGGKAEANRDVSIQ